MEDIENIKLADYKLLKKKMPNWLKEETRKMQKELEDIPPLWEELLFRIFRI